LVNLEEHVKGPGDQLADAERSLPTRAGGTYLVTAAPAAPPFVLRLEGLPATPAVLTRIRRRVEEINWELQRSEVAVRLRIM
jgi:hypothetical protein